MLVLGSVRVSYNEQLLQRVHGVYRYRSVVEAVLAAFGFVHEPWIKELHALGDEPDRLVASAADLVADGF